MSLADEIIPFVKHHQAEYGSDTNETTSVEDILEEFDIINNAGEIDNGEDEKTKKLRNLSISLSLYANITILIIKIIAYAKTLSLSVLATLLDTFLDLISQAILFYTEYQQSRIQRSSENFPSGASRFEPLGVLLCSSLMGMASFEVIKESVTQFFQQDHDLISMDQQGMASFWQMVLIVVIKIALMILCQTASRSNRGSVVKDATMEALTLDHLNDSLSNAVAAFALLAALSRDSLWFLDPVGAILISIYIMYSWYNTGREQITHLSGSAAPPEFVEEILDLVHKFDSNVEIDKCRAYHFGPKYLVELEIILPQNTILKESHDLGMKLQYRIENLEQVERCFVHIDYECRPYDEHVVSKFPGFQKLLVRHSLLE